MKIYITGIINVTFIGDFICISSFCNHIYWQNFPNFMLPTGEIILCCWWDSHNFHIITVCLMWDHAQSFQHTFDPPRLFTLSHQSWAVCDPHYTHRCGAQSRVSLDVDPFTPTSPGHCCGLKVFERFFLLLPTSLMPWFFLRLSSFVVKLRV